MRLRISRPAARAAAFTASAARVFYALAVETGTVHNGVWISALLGAILAIPLILAVGRSRGRGNRWLLAVLCVASLADSGLVLSAIARSSSFLTMDEVRPILLSLPALLAVFWCVTRNGDAIGYGSMLWVRIFPALLLPVVLLQWRHYRPAWLLPLLGDGWRAIGLGGLRTAGCLIPYTALALVCEDETPENSSKGSFVAALSGGAVLAALLLLPRLMMAPTNVAGDDWITRLDTLLTNGRAPLYLQLPMILLWYGGLFHLTTCGSFAAALLLQRLIPALDGRLCALFALLAALAVALSPLPSALPGSAAQPWLFPAVTALAALRCWTLKMKGGRRSCA